MCLRNYGSLFSNSDTELWSHVFSDNGMSLFLYLQRYLLEAGSGMETLEGEIKLYIQTHADFIPPSNSLSGRCNDSHNINRPAERHRMNLQKRLNHRSLAFQKFIKGQKAQKCNDRLPRLSRLTIACVFPVAPTTIMIYYTYFCWILYWGLWTFISKIETAVFRHSSVHQYP